MSTITPNMEVISVPGTISGSNIIRDLLTRIEDKLSRDCCLRSIDVYSGYSFRIQIQIQLADVYPQEIAAEIAEGHIDPKLEVLEIELGSDIRAVEPEPSNLERPVDPEGFIEEPVKEKRFYAPRGGVPKPLR